MKPICILLAALSLAGCSSKSSTDTKQAKAAPTAQSSNPLAKFIEVAGFRIREKKQGHLQIEFAVINHSEADISDLNLEVRLTTTAAKPGDAPLITFSTKVPSLGPEELKTMTVEVPTQLRVYELPDWQFLKAEFQVKE